MLNSENKDAFKLEIQVGVSCSVGNILITLDFSIVIDGNSQSKIFCLLRAELVHFTFVIMWKTFLVSRKIS